MGRTFAKHALWICAGAVWATGCADGSFEDNPSELISGVLLGEVLIPGVPDGMNVGGEATENGTGWLQKGPLLPGSIVHIDRIEADWTFGDSLTTEVDRSDGYFSFAGLPTGAVRVEATGPWFNEATGHISEQDVTLRGLAHTSRPMAINVFTHIAHDIAQDGILDGMDPQAVLHPSEALAHDALALAPEFLDTDAWTGEFHLGHPNTRVAAYTLWASAVISEAAQDQSMTEWLDELSEDLADDYALSKGNRLRIDLAADRLDPELVQAGLQQWCEANGLPFDAPGL